MFRVKNTTDKPQQVRALNGSEKFIINVPAFRTSDPVEEKYRKFFEQNEVEWAAILPEAEPEDVIVIESVGAPVIEKPKSAGRPKRKEA